MFYQAFKVILCFLVLSDNCGRGLTYMMSSVWAKGKTKRMPNKEGNINMEAFLTNVKYLIS